MKLQQFARSLKLPILLVILLGLTVCYGLFLQRKMGALRRLVTQTKQEEIIRGRLLRDLNQLEQEADRYRAYSLDTWIPLFKDSLQVRLFVLRYLSSLVSRYHGEGHDIEVSMGVKGSSGDVNYCDVTLKVKFKFYADMMELLRTLERRSPLFIVKEIGLNKEGSKIATEFKLVFAYRVKNEVEGKI
ncbi:MAG: hypothetical protein DRG50_05070 [Deltaproteobacteria bacterium]|nr:MAG: hypothetical protein DRG50_05070 [Deltaproteobacteria bacterium]